MVVGGARLVWAWLGCAAAGPGCVAATGCEFCGADAGCWATAVMVTASRAKTIQFMLLINVLINFRMTLVSKVSIRQLKYHVHNCCRIHCLPVLRGRFEPHLVSGSYGGF